MWRESSWKFHVIFCHKLTGVWSKSTPNSMTIPCHLSRFYLSTMLKHDIDLGQVQVMEFPWQLLRKWWDFHRIWSRFRIKPNYRQKHMRKSVSHFRRPVSKWEHWRIHHKSLYESSSLGQGSEGCSRESLVRHSQTRWHHRYDIGQLISTNPFNLWPLFYGDHETWTFLQILVTFWRE